MQLDTCANVSVMSSFSYSVHFDRFCVSCCLGRGVGVGSCIFACLSCVEKSESVDNFFFFIVCE